MTCIRKERENTIEDLANNGDTCHGTVHWMALTSSLADANNVCHSSYNGLPGTIISPPFMKIVVHFILLESKCLVTV